MCINKKYGRSNKNEPQPWMVRYVELEIFSQHVNQGKKPG